MPVPAEGKVLKHIAKARKRGKSYDRIADDLNADRIPTKGGGRWYPATVRSVWPSLPESRRQCKSAHGSPLLWPSPDGSRLRNGPGGSLQKIDALLPLIQGLHPPFPKIGGKTSPQGFLARQEGIPESSPWSNPIPTRP